VFESKITMKIMKTLAKLSWVAGLILLIQSCAKETSDSTSWEYNNSDNGGFQKVEKYDQETGPGLVLKEVLLLWVKQSKT